MQQPIQHQECLRACRACHEACLQGAARHLLAEEECDPLLAPRVRFLFEAADISASTADFIHRNSALAAKMCLTCAFVCEASARALEGAHDLDECAFLCLKCAGLCEEMSRLAPSTWVAVGEVHPHQQYLNGSHPL
jgi:hypothetical protein